MKYIYIFIALFSCAGFLSAQDTSLPERESNMDAVSSPDSSTAENNLDAIIQSLHFGYLSYSEVMKAMPEYQQALQSLAELKESYDEEMTRAEQDFSKKFAEYVDGQKSFPENIMLKRQKELQQLMEQSLQFKNEAQELLTKAEAELMEPIHAKLKEAIVAVGKSHNYIYVLNTDNNAHPYLNQGIAEDCTSAVLKELGIQ